MPNNALQSPEHHVADLRDYVRILRSRKWSILLILVLMVAATMFWSERQTPIYEGVADVLVKPVVLPGSTNVQDTNLLTERRLIQSEAVGKLVIEKLDLNLPVAAVIGRVQVDVVADTDVLQVKYRAPQPQLAARLAQGFAESYIDYRAEQALTAFQSAASAVQARIKGVQDELKKLEKKLNDPTVDLATKDNVQVQRDSLIAQLGVLQQSLLELEASQLNNQVNASSIIQAASLPSSPISPNKPRNVLFALFLGLALGVGVAFLRERMDDRIKGRHELERRMGAPVIAAVPAVGGWRRRDDTMLIMKSDPKSPVAEAYRTLATNIQYIASRQPLRVILITGAMGGEGKTTTSCNLAIALASSGRRVILVSADIRRPRLHKFFGVENSDGLTEVLSDELGINAAVTDPGIPNLRIMNAGASPDDPAGLLGTVGDLTESLANVSDYVLIDSPPVLAVADASIIAPWADGTLFVVDASKSSRSALNHAKDQLENAGANIIGIVFNNFDPTQSEYYPDYYSYTSASGYYGKPGAAGEANGNGNGLVGDKRKRPTSDAPKRGFRGIGKRRPRSTPTAKKF